MIVLKSAAEIAAMRRAGQVVAEVLRRAGDVLRPGLPTLAIDAVVAECYASRGAAPLLLGAPGPVPFPATVCVSVNDEAAHGVPGERRLSPGDVVSIDTACRLDGWCADAAWTWIVGEGSRETHNLVATGRQALERAIAACRAGVPLADVAETIERCARDAGCSIVGLGAGHGIGRELHEDPQVPNRVTPELLRADLRLDAGLALTIEPTVTVGDGRLRQSANGWTLITADGRPAAHFEHTVAITADGPLVLTAGIAD